MSFATIIVPAAPVRRKPRHQSEMTNQLLFGESVEILKEKGKLWMQVKSLHDGYEGWLTRTLLVETTREAAYTPLTMVTGGLLNTIEIGDQTMNVPVGSSLPLIWEGRGQLGNKEYLFR